MNNQLQQLIEWMEKEQLNYSHYETYEKALSIQSEPTEKMYSEEDVIVVEHRLPQNGEHYIYLSPKEWVKKEPIVITLANHHMDGLINFGIKTIIILL